MRRNDLWSLSMNFNSSLAEIRSSVISSSFSSSISKTSSLSILSTAPTSVASFNTIRTSTSISTSSATQPSAPSNVVSSSTDVSPTPTTMIDLRPSLKKEFPQHDFIDPENDLISIALFLPTNSKLSDFWLHFTLSVDETSLVTNFTSISTVNTATANVPRFFFNSNSLDTRIVGKNLTITVQIRPKQEGQFAQSVAFVTLVLRFISPPSGGTCSASTSGTTIAWNSKVNVSCSGWISQTTANITYAVNAVPIKTSSQLALLRSNNPSASSDITQWPIIGEISNGKNVMIALPSGWKEGNFSVALIASISVLQRSSVRFFIGTITVIPFESFEQFLNPSNNMSEITGQLFVQLKNASVDQTLQIAQSWSAALSELEDDTQKTKISNNLVQSVANALTAQLNASEPADFGKLKQATAAVSELLVQNPLQISKDTQNAAVGMLNNVVQKFVDQKEKIEIDQVKNMAKSFDAIMKSNLNGRVVSDENLPPSKDNSTSAEENEKQKEQDRHITEQFVEGVQAIALAIASSLAVNQEPVVIKTDTFQTVAQKTDVNSLSSLVKDDVAVVSNLGDAFSNYDFSAGNPEFAGKPKESQIILTKFTTFQSNPFAGISSDPSQNSRGRSSVSSISLSDEQGKDLKVENTPSCINLNFRGNFTFSYTVTNSSLNVSTIEFTPGTRVLNMSTNLMNHTTFILAPRCQYWDFDVSKWSMDGCEFVENREDWTLSTCCCRHLTDFSLEIGSPQDILSIRPKLPPIYRVITVAELQNVMNVVVALIVLVAVYVVGMIGLLSLRFLGSPLHRRMAEAKIQAEPLPKSKGSRFWRVYSMMLRVNHLWFSVFYDHSLVSTFTQIQRWTLCLTVLMTNLTIVTAFYASSVENNIQSNLWTDFITGIYVSLITFPFSSGLTLLFDRPIDQTETEQGQRIIKQLSILGYVMCLILLGVDIYFLLAYAVSFPSNAISPWLISFGGAIFDEVLLTGPMKCFALALLTVSGCSHRHEHQLSKMQERSRLYLEKNKTDFNTVNTMESSILLNTVPLSSSTTTTHSIMKSQDYTGLSASRTNYHQRTKSSHQTSNSIASSSGDVHRKSRSPSIGTPHRLTHRSAA